MTAPIVEDVDPAIEALVTAEGTQHDVVSDNLIAALMAIWAGFTAFYAGEAVASLGQQMARLVITGQRRSGLITESHLRLQIRRMGFEPPSGSVVDLPRDLRLGASTEDIYQRPVREVRYLESQGVPQVEAIETARERLEKQALTDLQLARATSAQQVLYRFPQATGWRRIIHPELGNVCGLCIAASDRVYQRIERLALHPGCVVEGTEVSATGVGAATRRRYEGPIAVLRTASGKELRLTPNHPVLTDRGWVQAGLLQKGERVVGHDGGQGDGGRGPDEQQRPTRVEDVWRSLTVGAGLLSRSVPLSPEDLHGDGGDGEVDVVLVDRHLAPVGDVSFFEPCSELGLVHAHGGWSSLAATGSLDLLGMGLFSAPRRIVSSLREQEPVFAGGLAVPDPGSFGIRADRYFSPSETADDRGAAYTELGRNLLDRLAGQIQLDEIVVVKIETFHGYVYNFQTVEGWYDASSIVVSNCKCTILPVIGEIDPGRALNENDLTLIYEAAGGTTASRALAQTRFRIEKNGELGEVLIPGQGKMRGPRQVKAQLSDRAKQMRKEQLQRQIAEMRPRAERSSWHQDRLEQLEELLRTA